MTASSPEGFDPEERWLEAGEIGGFTLRRTGFWPEASAEAPSNSLPPAADLYDLITAVRNRQREYGEPRMLVHSSSAARLGVFVVGLNVLERMDAEKLIHIPCAILKARQTKPDFVDDEEQLKLLFSLAKMHQQSFEEYSNFQ